MHVFSPFPSGLHVGRVRQLRQPDPAPVAARQCGGRAAVVAIHCQRRAGRGAEAAGARVQDAAEGISGRTSERTQLLSGFVGTVRGEI